MATLDDSPSVYSGQSWSTWAEKVPLGEDDDPDEDDPSNAIKDETNSMKLRKEDLPLFGYCPAQDELYLVVCEKCGQVVKPQALKSHLEKRHGSTKDSSSHHASSRLQSRGSNHGGVTSHRSSPQLHSSKSGIKQSCPASVKVDRTISDTVKMTSVEVTLKRLSDDVKTVSLHPEIVKSQNNPKRCNLTANSVSNGTVKSTANGAMTTSTDSSPSSTGPSVGSGIFCASLVNNTSPPHNISHKASTPSSYTSYSNKHLGLGHLPNSPNSNCAPSIERTLERDKNLDSSTSVKAHQSGCLSKNSSTSSTALTKSSPLSRSPSAKMKSCPSFTKTSSSNSMSNKSSSSSKTSSSPSKCSTSPGKNSNSPARSAPSPAKSASSPTKSAPSPSPVKGAPSPAKSPSKSAMSPSHCSTSSTPKRSSKAPKEKKFILCRDREFDPNVHCGVIRPDDGRHCTRSLTCKTHALSLRRAVPGRRKDFDELLKEHRAKKEALLKATESEKLALAGGHSAVAHPTNAATQEATTKLTSYPDQSVSLKESPSPLSSLSHKHLHPLSNTTTKTQKISSKSINSHHSKSSSSGLHSPTWFKEEMSPPSEVFSRLSSDGEIDTEDFQDKGDNPYISHHPRPISTCTFGGRCASGGWYLFSRKTDYLRSAFLSALEKHLHPPPHKKLCVESKLPKEPQFLTNSMDPYEFNIVDMTGGSNVYNQNSLANSVNKPQPVKQKSKPASSRSHKSKGDNCTSPRTGQSSFPNSPSPTGSHGAPLKRKRSSSGAGNSSTSPNIAALPNVSIQNTMLGNISLSTPIGTCLPNVNVNLGSHTLSRFNASLATSKGGQLHKNNLIKDASGGLNLVLATNMDQHHLLNGQYMNISGNVLEMAASQAGLHLEEKQTSSSKRSRSGGGVSKQNSNRQLATTNNPEGMCSITNNIMTNITQKAFLLDKPMLAPAVTSFPANSVVSLANSAMSPPQASPAATPSPFYRSGSVSPQVSTASPTPNGVISPVNMKAYSLSALNHITNQKTASPPASRNSTPSPNISLDSPTTHLTFIGQSPSNTGSHKSYNSKANSSYWSTTHPPTVLPNSVTFTTGAQTNHANSLHNFCVTNANIGSLPLKNASVNVGKNIPIPVPFTLPLTMASNLTNQQQQTATLFVTSDNVPKAEIQLQQSSTHSNVIS